MEERKKVGEERKERGAKEKEEKQGEKEETKDGGWSLKSLQRLCSPTLHSEDEKAG